MTYPSLSSSKTKFGLLTIFHVFFFSVMTPVRTLITFERDEIKHINIIILAKAQAPSHLCVCISSSLSLFLSYFFFNLSHICIGMCCSSINKLNYIQIKKL